MEEQVYKGIIEMLHEYGNHYRALLDLAELVKKDSESTIVHNLKLMSSMQMIDDVLKSEAPDDSKCNAIKGIVGHNVIN